MNSLENLKFLKDDMEKKGWIIDSFLFCYKNVQYIVLVKLYEPDEAKPQYALLKLEFIKKDNISDSLEIPANSQKLLVDAKTLREFFGIEYKENLGSILRQFTDYLGQIIPTKVSDKITKEQKYAMERELSFSNSEDPDKKYCYKVKRNGNKKDGSPGQRSPYNDNITRLRRPILYKKLGEEKTLSFCYSRSPDDEKTDEAIIFNWTKNNS